MVHGATTATRWRAQWQCGVYPQRKQISLSLGCTHAQKLHLGAAYFPLWTSLPARESSLSWKGTHTWWLRSHRPSYLRDTIPDNSHNIRISTDLRDRQTEKKKRDTVPEWRKLQSFLDHITKKMHICSIIHSPLMHAWVKWHSFACRQSYWTGCTQLYTNSPHTMASLDDSRNRMNSRKLKLHIEVLRSVVRCQLSEGVQKTVIQSSLPWVQEHLFIFFFAFHTNNWAFTRPGNN